MRLTESQIAGLRKAIAGATPGPWSWEPMEGERGVRYQSILAVGGDNPSRGSAICETYHHKGVGPIPSGPFAGQILRPRNGRSEDAAYISQANPAVITGLLDELEEKTRALKACVPVLQAVGQHPANELLGDIEKLLGSRHD